MPSSFREPSAPVLESPSLLEAPWPDPSFRASDGDAPPEAEDDALLAEESAVLHAIIRRLVSGDDLPDHLLAAIPELRRLIETHCTVLRTRRTIAGNRDPLKDLVYKVLDDLGREAESSGPDRG
jgi:hypothetical protein